MAAACDLNAAKKNLQESLGDHMKIYLQNLKSWFKQKISKEDFDLEARRLLSDDAVHLHNEFLLAIIARCQTLTSSLVPKESSLLGKSASDQSKQSKPPRQKFRKRPPSSRSTFQQRFVPANPVAHAPEVNFKGAEDIVFAARELSLPDITMVHGRMLVCAWESGLEDVSDMAVRLVMQSIENQLKNLISLVLSQRSGYKLREKKFRFAVGTQVKNPYLRHANLIEDENTESEATMISQTGNHIPSRKSPLEIGEGAAAEQLASANQPAYKGPVSLFDLIQSLQLYKSAIPSHTVYSVAMERVIHRLWHPSHEEINQHIIHTQEMALKQQMSTPTSSSQATSGQHLSSKHHHGKHHHHHHHHHH
ncbi:transcriptional adapter 1-like [Pecten maximus]|uniref:transcriptional adapter 1-like n=1 Tax=Pecten maximus TaxID=6579 RepID=UPI0014580AAC|nr:transcriptional adapter 1-like [Pecten maximus]